MNALRSSLLTLLVLVSGCAKQEEQAATPEPAEPASAAPETPPEDAALKNAVAGAWRSDANKTRDVHRHPSESLAFWGLAPGMTVLEVQPGAGWWTEILAPYTKATGGSFYATASDPADKQIPKKYREMIKKSREEYQAKFTAAPDTFGEVKLINWDTKSEPLPANTFDFILSARSVHGWVGQGRVESAFSDFFTALKPGGILAIEQHRANPGQQDPKAANGYVAEEYVIEQAKKAGFELVAQSEINANAKDTKDHPFGVWTLPPTRRTTAYGSAKDEDPNFDRTKYDAIGESDRMTLKFRKPA